MKKLIAFVLGLMVSISSAFAAGVLPSGYTEFDYIVFDGNTYIDTGITSINSGATVKIKFAPTTDTGTHFLYGKNPTSGAQQVGFFLSGSALYWQYGISPRLSYDPVSAGTIYDLTLNNGSMIINGTTKSGETEAAFGLDHPVLIGGAWSSSSSVDSRRFVGKIYSFSYTLDNNTVAIFVPAKRNSDNAIGMYNILDSNPSTAFKTNAGTGSFTGGNELDPCRNLFDSSIFNTSAADVTYFTREIPNGTYTMSSPDFPIGSNGWATNVWILAGQQTSGADSTTNGVSAGTPRTITVTDGHYTFAYRSTVSVNNNNPKNFRWQIEQGTSATRYVPYSRACHSNTCHAYTSATGTVTQNGTPTPTNPIEPKFYTQGNITLRKVGDVADSYDASTGIITRRVGEYVFDGTETWSYNDSYSRFVTNISDIPAAAARTLPFITTHYQEIQGVTTDPGYIYNGSNKQIMITDTHTTVAQWKEYLAQQKTNGTPVTIYYPLAEATTEYVGTEWCEGIKIATNAFNAARFSPVVTALNTAISTIKTVVANTIAQTTAIGNLQSGKQTRPADAACPDYKQCLLVEDSSGVPHWYVISDPFRDFVAPIIATNTAPASTTNNSGYTQLEYLESTAAASYIDFGINSTISATKSWFVVRAARTANSNSRDMIATMGDATMNHYVEFNATNAIAVGDYMGSYNTTVDTFYDIKLETTATKGTLYVNGTEVGSSTNYTSRQNYPVRIFKLADSYSGKNIKISYFEFGTDDTTRIKAIPVRRNSDGAYGMYNLMNNTFYPNAASSGDDFTPGPEVINQDPAIPRMTWTATWTGTYAGVVSGEARCTSVSGSGNGAAFSSLSAANQTTWNTPFTSSTVDNYMSCWCKTSGVTVDGENVDPMGTTEWTYYGTSSNPATCIKNCASFCAYGVNNTASFRKALFGQ